MKIKSSFSAESNTAILCLGSNLGQRGDLLRKAAELIGKKCGRIIKSSGVYETEAWGSESERAYLNQVLVIETGFTPAQLLEAILEIEVSLGRKRTKNRNADRLIDIDILFFNNLVTHQNELIIPHPRLHNRRFVLMPLNEIVPELIHPQLNKSVRYLLEHCGDLLAVHLFGSRG